MLLGIDVGTSSVKAVLFDPQLGRLIAQARETFEIRFPAPEIAEIDPEIIWRTTCRALNSLRAASATEFADISGIGLSVIFPALIPMDQNGKALFPAILYCDFRARQQAETFAGTFGRASLEQQTGNRFGAGTTTLPGILWLREQQPEIFRKTHIFGQLSTFLIHRLTGEFVVDLSHASLSGMARAGNEREWEEKILEAAELERHRLPRLLEPTTVVGTTTRSAGAGGLPAEIPVVAGCGDAPLSTLGGGICTPGQVFASAGSTDCIMCSAGRPSTNPVFCNIRTAVPNLWVINGTISSAGAAVKWFHENFMPQSLDEMTARAETAPPGSRGTVFLPYLQGERTPHWDSAARGIFFGLSLSSGQGEACRAVFEGIACAWRQVITLLEKESGIRAEAILVAGGGGTNPLMNRIKATLLDRPLQILDFTDITSLGAALIAGVGTQIYRTPAEACAATKALRTYQTISPVPEWGEIYEETYRIYCSIYPANKDIFP